MRLLYLHPKSWIGEYAILRKFRELGHEVCVLEEQRGLPQGKRHLAEHFRDPGDGIRTLWYDPRRGWERLLTWVPDRVFRRGFDGRNLVHRMWVIAEAVRRFAPDAIVCSDGFTYAISAAFLKRLRLLRTRLIVSYIGGDILDNAAAEYGRRRTGMTDWLIRTSLSGADILRPVSPMLRDVLLRDGADRSRVRVCPSHLGTDEGAFARIRSERTLIRERVRTRYGIAQDAPVVVTLSGNQKGKGMQVLGEAWPAILSACPGARWLLCGHDDPWLARGLWPSIERQGLRDTVIATGILAAPATFDHLAAAELNVNPSLCEGLNMVTVEAAAVGTPSVTSDAAGIAQWVESFRAGAVVPSGDPAALASAVIRALKDRGMRERWAAAGLAMAREFSVERIARELLDLARPE
ncbi:MAG TPA: glycosyltransferase family 4 protein [Burkholderiales bacterium]|nr:glycosyltransferase family 4 protein [Burkholderiales bacterium]